jgi:glycine hydroxymethyltransferase
VDNAKVLAETCIKNGLEVLTGGTDNHLLLINVGSMGLTGRMSETAIRDSGITLNRNSIPFDPNGAWYTSGLRIGTPATTSLGMGAVEMKKIGEVLSDILKNMAPSKITKGGNAGKLSKANYILDQNIVKTARKEVKSLLDKYPVYPGINVDFLKSIC